MRVLHVLDHSIPVHSGYTFRTRAILQRQRAMGWETLHVTSPKHPLESAPRETVEGYEFYRTPPVGSLWGRLPIIREFALMHALRLRLDSVVRETAPDIIHVHSPVLNAFPALRIGARYAIPVLYEVRAFWEDAAVSHGTARSGGIRYRVSQALESRAVGRADAVTTICEGLRNDLIGRGVSANKVTVIPNAVDIEQFDGAAASTSALAASLGLEGMAVLGFIGSFYGYEGLHILIEAMPSMLERDANIRLLLIGGGPEEDNLKSLAVRLGVADQVVFTGRVPHDQVPAYYGLADIMVYPRISSRLTDLVTPLKPLEAMAQRKIVVLSDVGGHSELLDNGRFGRMFQAGSAPALALAILRALDERASWPEETEQGRRYVETERTWKSSVERYRDVYARLLADQPARGQ